MKYTVHRDELSAKAVAFELASGMVMSAYLFNLNTK